MKLCSIDGCSGSAIGRGWCASHYRRWSRHGDPLAGRTPVGEAHRFLDDAVKFRQDGCLTWPYAKSENGYGNIFIEGRNHVVSRVVCERVNGPPPSDAHEAAHSCGRGHEGCIAPLHLSWALPVQNAIDRYMHGTDGVGSSNPSAKLSESSVTEILSAKGVESQEKLAKRFGITQSMVSRIHRRVAWQHVGA